MRAFSLVALLGVALAGTCDVSTCYKCKNISGCDWYETGPVSDCRATADASKLGLTPTTTCPQCQAGSCSDCHAINGMNATSTTTCGWFEHSVFGGTCAVNTSSPGTVGTYTLVDQCPPCAELTTCESCQNSPAKCGWWVLPGGASSKCAEASPGFAYSKTALGACDVNKCAGSPTCKTCSDINTTVNNVTTFPCAWYASKESTFYNSKCDVNETGLLNDQLYDTVAKASCPACSGSTCTACQAEPGCSWIAVVVGSVSSFGQCVTNAAVNSVPTKKVVTVCPKTCEIYSCSACVAKPECRWFIGDAVRDATCDRATDADQHPFMQEVSAAAQCPSDCKNKATRCYECSQETGCGWYQDTLLGKAVPLTGSCRSDANPGTNVKETKGDDAACEGNPSNGALNLAPGFVGLAIVAFLY